MPVDSVFFGAIAFPAEAPLSTELQQVKMQLIANISLLFIELPFLQRFEAAAEAGFDGVEIQFPYSYDIADIHSASKTSNMPVVLINVPAGDLTGGEAGFAALPAKQAEFSDALEKCTRWADELNVEKVNILAGIGTSMVQDDWFDILVSNLKIVGDRFGRMNVAVQLEAINPFDVPGFLVPNLDTALTVLEAVDHPNVQLQFDFYHMARTEPSLTGAIASAGRRIGHVQFADTNGRHEPGSGDIDFQAAITALLQSGYTGCLSAEYVPLTDTLDGLQWMQEFHQILMQQQ